MPKGKKGFHYDTVAVDDDFDTSWVKRFWAERARKLGQQFFGIEPMNKPYSNLVDPNKNTPELEEYINNAFEQLKDLYGIGERPIVEKSPFELAFSELMKLATLQGSVLGNEYITHGHKYAATRRKSMAKRRFFDEQGKYHSDDLMEIEHIIVGCSCKWVRALNLQETYSILQNNNFGRLNKIYLEHIKVPWEEIKYVSVPLELLEDAGSDFITKLNKILIDHGGIIHNDYDTRTVIIIDDQMSEEGLDKLADLLEGHPVGEKVLKVYQKK